MLFRNLVRSIVVRGIAPQHTYTAALSLAAVLPLNVLSAISTRAALQQANSAAALVADEFVVHVVLRTMTFVSVQHAATAPPWPSPVVPFEMNVLFVIVSRWPPVQQTAIAPPSSADLFWRNVLESMLS